MNGINRTPKMMQIFAHNSLLMSEKRCLIFEKKRDNQAIIPLSGEGGIRTPGTFDSTPDFESGTLNRSDISPDGIFFQGANILSHSEKICFFHDLK